VINIINFTCKDNPPEPVRGPTGPVWPAAPAKTRESSGPRAESMGARIGHAVGLAAAVLLSWLAFIPRRLGDHLFTVNDNEAYWRGWQIAKVHGGLGRRYRDPRFDTLTGCSKCRESGALADAPCGPCLGTGRITIDGVS